MHVAGITGANPDNPEANGVVGVAPNAQVRVQRDSWIRVYLL